MNDKNMVNLWNGLEIPRIGLGPGIIRYKDRGFLSAVGAPVSRWNIPLRAYNKCVTRLSRSITHSRYIAAVAKGLRAGFRLVDYSTAYGPGEMITKAIDIAGLRREEVFLTGRISNRAQIDGPDAVREQIHNMLQQYRAEYVDLLMFHWPVTGCFEQTWKVICAAYEKGYARSVGVANCNRHHLDSLMKVGLKPMVNQFEIHPLFTQKDLIKYNQDCGIVVEAYTPIARHDERLMRLPKLRAIAREHGKTPVQVVLRWHVQNGCIPIVRSLNAGRQKEDYDIFDFELSKDDMDVIDSFNINSRLRYDPDNCDFTIL